MADFKATDDGDLDISDGIQIVTGIDEARQRLDYAINLNLGEWYINLQDGLPLIPNPEIDLSSEVQYFTSVKLKDIPEIVTSSIVEYVESLDYINEVSSSSYTFSTSTRKLQIDFVCKYIDGSDIDYTAYVDI